MNPEALVSERGKTHGDWDKQARLAQSLKGCIRIAQEPIRKLSKGQQEALEAILVKVSRIVCGDPSTADHWNDIAGYAVLGRDSQGL